MTTVTGSADVDPALSFALIGDQLTDARGRARLALDDELRRRKLNPADHKTARVVITVEVDVP